MSCCAGRSADANGPDGLRRSFFPGRAKPPRPPFVAPPVQSNSCHITQVHGHRAPSRDGPQFGIGEQALDKERFWNIVEQSRIDSGGEQDAQVAALTAILATLSVGEIEQFDARFREAMAEAYRWDLWAAAYLIQGGCSDDGFEYFCDWLISLGKHRFEAALRNPDSLAEVIEDEDDEEGREFEAFAAAVIHVWANKTGKDILEMPRPAVQWPRGLAGGPAGEPWQEQGDEYFVRVLPKLKARFG